MFHTHIVANLHANGDVMRSPDLPLPSVYSDTAAAAPAQARWGLYALAVGVIGLNLAAAQPLVGVIGPDLALGADWSGLITMATMLGYAAGLLLLVPLADLVENRRLVLAMLAADALSLGAAAAAPNASVFLLASFDAGAAMSCIQVLVPLAASLTPEAQRGRVIGNIMSGTMIGILLSRPLASLCADAFGWRGMFVASAAAIVLLMGVLAGRLPRRFPSADLGYARLIGSLWTLLREERVLRLRAASAALAFAAFSTFWATVALLLARQPFALGARGIAVFAFAGAAGAVAAPLAGRWGDRGWTRPLLVAMHLGILLALCLAALAVRVAAHAPEAGLGLLVLATLLLDFGVVGDQTLGRRAVNLLRPDARGRINGLFTGVFFIGGGLAAALTGFAWSSGGWDRVCALAAVFGVAALGISLTTLRDARLG